MRETRIAVFASGEGTNAARLIELGQRNELGGGKVVLMVSDKPDCGAVRRSREAGIPAFAARVRVMGGRDGWESAAAAALRERRVDLVVLAGFMRMVGSVLLCDYGDRMINVHPSLLPAFRGLDAVGQALHAGVPETGVTVHRVTAELDAGPILGQTRVPIRAADTRDSLLARVHEAEHELLPAVIRAWCEGRVNAAR